MSGGGNDKKKRVEREKGKQKEDIKKEVIIDNNKTQKYNERNDNIKRNILKMNEYDGKEENNKKY